MKIVFESVIRRRIARFTCICCGKPNRTRKLTAEQTVNPYNRGDDGMPLSRRDISINTDLEAARMLEEFLVAPVCATCENAMNYDDRRALREKRVAKTLLAGEAHE